MYVLFFPTTVEIEGIVVGTSRMELLEDRLDDSSIARFGQLLMVNETLTKAFCAHRGSHDD
jgi:hypothetical protein